MPSRDASRQATLRRRPPIAHRAARAPSERHQSAIRAPSERHDQHRDIVHRAARRCEITEGARSAQRVGGAKHRGGALLLVHHVPGKQSKQGVGVREWAVGRARGVREGRVRAQRGEGLQQGRAGPRRPLPSPPPPVPAGGAQAPRACACGTRRPREHARVAHQRPSEASTRKASRGERLIAESSGVDDTP